jgi:hypothetical protein
MSAEEGSGYPLVAAAPVLGLALNVFVHIVCSRMFWSARQMRALGAGALAGVPMAAMLTLCARTASPLWGGESWLLLAFNVVLYFALAYGYFHFVNLNLASLRIRVLCELGAVPAGLSESELLSRYGSEAIVAARLDRLVQGGHLQLRDGRYVLGPNWVFLLLFEVFEFMKFMVLGRGSRLLDNIPHLRRSHPLLGIFIFASKYPLCRLVAAGVVNTVLGYGLYCVLVWWGVDYRAALVVLTAVTMVSTFLAYRYLLTSSCREHLVVRCVCVCGVVYLVNERVLAWAMTQGVGLFVAQALVLPFVVALSFALNQFCVFGGGSRVSRKSAP